MDSSPTDVCIMICFAGIHHQFAYVYLIHSYLNSSHSLAPGIVGIARDYRAWAIRCFHKWLYPSNFVLRRLTKCSHLFVSSFKSLNQTGQMGKLKSTPCTSFFRNNISFQCLVKLCSLIDFQCCACPSKCNFIHLLLQGRHICWSLAVVFYYKNARNCIRTVILWWMRLKGHF